MKKAVIGIMFLAALVNQAQAVDILEYSTVGPWTISVDPTMGNGCFVLAEFEDGAVFRLGFDMRDDPRSFYVIFGNATWRSIEYGKTYQIQMRFGDESAWEGKATGFSFDPPENQHWLSLDFSAKNGIELVAEFMSELLVAIHYNKKEIMRLNLKRSYQAGLQLLKCQDSANQEKEDPFKDASSSNDDPFKY